MNHETIIKSGETEGTVEISSETMTMKLAAAYWAQGEYPHAGHEVAVDEINMKAYVRDPGGKRARTIDGEEDPGRGFDIIELTRK